MTAHTFARAFRFLAGRDRPEPTPRDTLITAACAIDAKLRDAGDFEHEGWHPDAVLPARITVAEARRLRTALAALAAILLALGACWLATLPRGWVDTRPTASDGVMTP